MKLSKQLTLPQITQTGYYYCNKCERVTKKVQRGVKFVCLLCNAEATKHITYVKGIDEL